MAHKCLIFCTFLIVSSLVVVPRSTDARALRIIVDRQASMEGQIANILDGLYLQAMKTGGPSRGGDGHAETHSLNDLAKIHNSGPSPGAGN